jgi:hypothetical protein
MKCPQDHAEHGPDTSMLCTPARLYFQKIAVTVSEVMRMQHALLVDRPLSYSSCTR